MANINIKAVFDNGGGLTLKLGNYFCHYYNDMEVAANDCIMYSQYGNTNRWENGKDEEIDPTPEQIANGSYKVFTFKDLQFAINNNYKSGWENIDSFIKALLI
jgi:hypothetical protein